MRKITRLAGSAAMMLLSMMFLPAAYAQGLQAGAARIDITPGADQLPPNYLGVNDRIYVRTIVLDQDGQRAALITLDAGGIPTRLWQEVSERLQEFGIPGSHLLLTATHTHSVPRGGNNSTDLIVDSVRQAISNLQPATMSYGEGQSWININRNMINPETGLWDEGPNYDGVSDKTVAVLAFHDTDGEPIAVYYNYGVHGVIAGQLDEVSGDIPGASSRYIEQSLGDDVVAVWSTAASGDQNPIFFQQTYDLRQIRIDDYASRGEDISNSMPPGGTGLDRTNVDVIRLMDQQRQMLVTMGQMLGEEVLHVLRAGLERPRDTAVISAAQTTVTCPGRRRTDSGREGYAGTYEDGPDVELLLSLLRIGDTWLGGVNAEVFTPIALRFMDESPYKHTMMVTLTNGTANSGYVPHDAAFGYHTFEVLGSRLKQGCAEGAIVNGLLDLMAEVN